MIRMIRKSDLRLMLILLPFFIPQYIMNLGRVSLAVELYKILVLFYVFGSSKKNEDGLPLVLYLVVIFKVLDLIPFLLGDGFSLRTLYLWSKDFYTVFLICYIIIIECKRDYKNIIQKLYWIMSLWIILHVICFYATGIELVGIRTKLSHSYIVCLTLCLVCKELSGRRFKIYDSIFLVLSIYYIFDRSISTLIVTTAVLFIGYFLAQRRLIQAVCNYYVLISAGIILNLSILFLRIQNYFKWLIVDILHENIYLNARTFIWDSVIPKCLEKLWLGHGITGENTRGVYIYVLDPVQGLHIDGSMQVHNQLLSVLYFNGIIGLGLFIGMILSAGTRLKKCINRRIAVLLTLGMTAIVLAAIAELSCENIYFYVLLICVAVSDYSNKSGSSHEIE